ncbi:MAG: uncharacterized protein KVP18_004241 [Porospora cf. gigantea A]|nr:MAG: hypothetical protein KVP18_004241 [Porospora cf. gigantea A]
MTYGDGSVYEGQWVRDQRHGQGVLLSAVDGRQYEGDWSCGKREGKGRLLWPNGDVLTAVWKKGGVSSVTSFVFGPDSVWADR